MLTGQQWSSEIPTLHGTWTSTDRQCKSKGGQAIKLQTYLPPLYFYCRSVIMTKLTMQKAEIHKKAENSHPVLLTTTFSTSQQIWGQERHVYPMYRISFYLQVVSIVKVANTNTYKFTSLFFPSFKQKKQLRNKY